MTNRRRHYYIDCELERLAQANPDANDPYEPFCGVSALFNADHHKGNPAWAPRDEWSIRSSVEIVFIGGHELD